MRERNVIVRVREGLHARPATEFVKLARSFQSSIEVWRDGRSASAKSAVKLMLLGVKEQHEIVLRAEGEDETLAIEALSRFAEAAGEDPVKVEAPAQAPHGLSRGAPASAGAAIGPVYLYMAEDITAPCLIVTPDHVEGELTNLRRALADVDIELARRGGAVAPDAEEAEINAALRELGRDEELSSRIEARVRAGADAVTASLQAGAELAAEFAAVADPYLRARGEDVSAFVRQVAFALLGKRQPSLSEAPDGAVILADDISAFDLGGASVGRFGGLVALSGGATSHVAIIARSYGVPAVLGVALDREALLRARVAALDGSTGEVALDPDAATAARFHQRIDEEQARKRELFKYASAEPRTRSGRLIEVAANLGSLKEVESALQFGAMGVGLFRTELLFMERKRPPTEDEQAVVYTKLAQAFAPHSVVIRTLDVGGDKATPGVAIAKEDNPFLGCRGVRLCLRRPEIFKPQLRALLRANAVAGNVKAMLPMVADIEEVREVKRIVAECQAELEAAGVAQAAFDLGVMAETPAAAFAAESLAREVAFFSIGTNDLTQYVMAADRLNPEVAHLYRPDHPAVMKAVEMICDAAKSAGIGVGVCGEAAARPDMIAKFIALGVTELSMSPFSIPAAKKAVIECD